jgi:glycosyltransferase family protein
MANTKIINGTGLLMKISKKIYRKIYRFKDNKLYKIGWFSRKLNILNTEETLKLIEQDKVSFLRYGDGELAIINGGSIPFQDYDEMLSKRLKDLLSINEEKLKIGIPYYYTNPMSNLNEFVDSFALSLANQRKFLCRECRKDMTYIDTAITQVYQTYRTYDFDDYYSRMQSLIKDRDITIVCGDGVLDKLEHKAFNVCKSVEFVYAPSKNAYSEYDEILNKVLRTKRDRLICIVLGPTANILAYDLYKQGYQAWDMGHYFKDYDAYIRRQSRDSEAISKFYRPD